MNLSLASAAQLGPWPGLLLATALAGLAFWWYRRHLAASGAARWLLPGCRAAAVGLAAMLVAQPMLTVRSTEGAVGRVVVAIDASASMGVGDENAKQPRLQRLETALCRGGEPLLSRLASAFDVDVLRFDGAQPRALWSSRLAAPPQPPPLDLGGPAVGRASDLAALVAAGDGPGPAPTAVIVLSDGRRTAGEPPEAAARILAGRGGTELHMVAVGATKEPADAAIEAIELPEQVHVRDRLSGVLRLKDTLAPGTAMTVRLHSGDIELGSWPLTGTGDGQRSLPFAVDLAPAVAAILAGDDASQRSGLLLPLLATVEVAGGDVQPANDRLEGWVRITLQRRSVLLADDRPRWEWRFLDGLLGRDEQWQLTRALVSDGRLPRGPTAVPDTRDGWLALDVAVLGDLDPALLGPASLGWLREFVELRGGGLVLIDGREGRLATLAAGPAGPLMPVRRGSGTWHPTALRTTAATAQAAWLRLGVDALANAAAWAKRTPPEALARAVALPGAEVLLEAVDEAGTSGPVVVSRRFGAGQVVWIGHAESWRWRAVGGAQATSQLWNQLLRAVAEEPYAVSTSRTAFDPGGPRLQPGQRPLMRVRLREASGAPRLGARPALIILQDGRQVARVPLAEDGHGIYRAHGPTLAAGRYDVRLAPDGSEPDGPSTVLVVDAASDGELAYLSCDHTGLQQVADAAGGKLWEEADLDKLAAALVEAKGQRAVERTSALWTSWWWFGAITMLLSIELLIRRRQGLP